jgi:hypothetical protein
MYGKLFHVVLAKSPTEPIADRGSPLQCQ